MAAALLRTGSDDCTELVIFHFTNTCKKNSFEKGGQTPPGVLINTACTYICSLVSNGKLAGGNSAHHYEMIGRKALLINNYPIPS